VKNDEPEKRFQELTEDMHPDKKRKLETCVGALVIQRMRAVVCCSGGGLGGPVSLAMTAMAMPPAKRLADCHLAPASTSTTNNLPERHDLKQNGLSALEKIKTMDSIYKKQQMGTTKLTEGAKSFCKKFLHPAINC
jgi:hypothetical protein